MKITLFLFFGVLTLPLAAQDPGASATVDSRLRDALRTTTLQLQDAQNQLVTAQSAQAQSAKDEEELKAKVEALGAQFDAAVRQSSADKAASDKSIADLQGQVGTLKTQVASYAEAIEEWKKAYTQATTLAQAKEAARADLAGKVIQLQQLVEDRERKNLALYRTGNEILDRYEHFGLGDALTAREPFVGTTRVYLQEQVQDYHDKLLDQSVPGGAAAAIIDPTASSRVAAGAPKHPKDLAGNNSGTAKP